MATVVYILGGICVELIWRDFEALSIISNSTCF